MTITAKVAAQVAKFKDGTAFTYDELQIDREEYPGAAKAMERLLKTGIISRVSTGLFYKPRKTVLVHCSRMNKIYYDPIYMRMTKGLPTSRD